MWARVSTYEGKPEALEASVAYVRENIVPAARQLAGFRGVYLLGDRETGRSLSVTLWDSEADLRASEEAANRLRADSAQHSGETIVAVERYEILYDEMA
jgi:heme-degrading monooxygenase HmoA